MTRDEMIQRLRFTRNTFVVDSEAIDQAIVHLSAEGVSVPVREGSGGWQPMETAPKDGTSILIARTIYGLACVDFAWFTSGDTGPHWRNYEAEHLFPTHWMPLPDPPKAEGER